MTLEIHAQALLLESLLTQRPLPGMAQILTIPDFVASDDNGQIILVDDRDPLDLDFPSKVTIMTREEIESLTLDDQQRVFEFLPPEHFPGKVSVRLRLSIAWPGRGLLPVGEIVATFSDRDPLTAVEPTNMVAY